MLRFSRLGHLVRMAGGGMLQTRLSFLVGQTATVCSVCSAIIRKAQQQRLQQYLQHLQSGAKTWHVHHLSPVQKHKLLVPPSRHLQHTSFTFPNSSQRRPSQGFGISRKHWTYEGPTGVDHWAEKYPDCGGDSQSPVDIITADAEANSLLAAFRFSNFKTVDGVQWDFTNNGHSAQVTYEQGDLRVSGGGLGSEYQVAQFHFHWGASDDIGSEHTIDSKQFPMEMHIVTYNRNYGDMSNATAFKDGLAVLGMFFQVADADNADFSGLISALGNIKAPETSTSPSPVPLDSLMPKDKGNFWRYSGSLTTPPCTEVVVWTLFENAIPISSAQLEAFRGLLNSDNEPLVNNFRPVQNLNGRKIYRSF